MVFVLCGDKPHAVYEVVPSQKIPCDGINTDTKGHHAQADTTRLRLLPAAGSMAGSQPLCKAHTGREL